MNVQPLTVKVTDAIAGRSAAKKARDFAVQLGFATRDAEEISLVVSELATNLIKHAGGGDLQFSPLESSGRTGIQITSEDRGPGIPALDVALTDGYSTVGTLGKGLGAVNRLMDELEFSPRPGAGQRIVCQRWMRPTATAGLRRWLEFGVATRPHRNCSENGDAFVIRQWDGHALAGVIDGVGHGSFAQRASQTARHYLEQHFDQPLETLFRGVDRACRATRGVVMGLARFEQQRQEFTAAIVGNVEMHLLGSPAPLRLMIRRGIVGLSGAPKPVPTTHAWTPTSVLVVHSDGVSPKWQTGANLALVASQPPGLIAHRLLELGGRLEDDATVLVVRNKL